MEDNGIEIGKEVKDKLVGFQGIVTAKTEHMTGCNRYEVTPQKLKEDGSYPDSSWFDGDELEVIGEGVNPETVRGPVLGGPRTRSIVTKK